MPDPKKPAPSIGGGKGGTPATTPKTPQPRPK